MAETITALEWLGLPPDADARAVKREYAQRLKRVRPDVDPAGFQFLHNVYQMALQQCSMRDAALSAGAAGDAYAERAPIPTRVVVEESLDADPSFRSENIAFASTGENAQADWSVLNSQVNNVPADADSPLSVLMTAETETLDFASFYAELLRVAAPGDGATVSTWLLQQRALWSLRAKSGVAAQLIAALHRELPPLHESVFDALLDFFDLRHLRSGLDPLALQELQRRLQLRWDFTPDDVAERAQRLLRRHRYLYLSQDSLATLLRRLARPLPWWRLLTMAAWPDSVGTYGRLLRSVLGTKPREVPDSVNSSQARFWLAASDSTRLSLVRIGIALVRCLAVVALAAAFGFLLSQQPSHTHHVTEDMTWVGVIGGGAYLGLLLWQALVRWQGKLESNERLDWQRWLFVPLVVLASVVIPTEWARAASTLLCLAAALSYARMRTRAGKPVLWGVQTGPREVIDLSCLLLGLLIIVFNFPMAGVAIALTFWTADAWRHRYLLRRR